MHNNTNIVFTKPLPTSIKEKERLAQRAVSLLLLHQGKRRTSKDLKGDKPPPAPDQDLQGFGPFKVDRTVPYRRKYALIEEEQAFLDEEQLGLLA